MISKLFVISMFFASTLSFAQDNLISCGSSAGFQFRCSVPDMTSLLAAQSVESDYKISYQLTCNRNYPGPVPSQLRMSLSNGASLTLNYNDRQENILVGTGSGELALVDSNPKEMAVLKFRECSLKIWDVKATPSTTVVAAWAAEKTSLESQILLAAAARDANQSLAVLEASLNIYSKFMDNILTTEVSENDLITTITDLKSCATSSDDPVTCERTIDKLATASSLFGPDEITRLSKLQSILDRVNFAAISCPADGDCAKTILKKYLSDEDLALLGKAKDKLKDADGASGRASTFAKQVEDLTAQLNALKEKSRGSIQW